MNVGSVAHRRPGSTPAAEPASSAPLWLLCALLAAATTITTTTTTTPPLSSHCNIRRAPLSTSTFRGVRGLHPILFTRGGEDAPALDALSSAMALPALTEAYGHVPVILASSNALSSLKKTTTLRTHVEAEFGPNATRHTRDTRSNDSWYLFGDSFDPAFRPLVTLYPIPPPAEEEPLVVWGVGALHSGVPFHIHGPAWAEVVLGRKRWWLFPPGSPPTFDEGASMLAWALDNDGEGGGDGGGDGGGGGGALRCTAGPGEVLYIPPFWWHATLNLDAYNAFVSTFTQERD